MTSMCNKILFVALLVFAVDLGAKKLTKEAIEGETSIGIMLQTFDPVTLGHDRLIKDALLQNKFNKIVVIPNDFTPHKFFCSKTSLRHDLLHAAYKDDEQILIVDAYEYGYPQSRGVITFLKSLVDKVIAVGIASDYSNISNRRKNTTQWLLPVAGWLLAVDGETNEDHDTIFNKPTDYFVTTLPKSSAVVRKYFQNHPQFFSMSKEEIKNISDEILPVATSVRMRIYDQKYNFRSWYCGGYIQDLTYSTCKDLGTFFNGFLPQNR